MFEKGTPCSGFRFKDCKDPNIQEFAHAKKSSCFATGSPTVPLAGF
jgi:hypothetical protein